MRRLATAFLIGLGCGPAAGGGEACPPGEEGCACEENGDCDSGLQCFSDLCVDLENTSGDATITVTGSSVSASSMTSATTDSTSDATATTSVDSTGPIDTGTTNADTSTQGSETSTTGVCDGPDGDGDGVCDDVDNCPMNENPDQADNDSKFTDYDADTYFNFPLYCPGDCHALLHVEDGSWTTTYTLDLGGAAPTGARLRLYTALDDSNGGTPYCITIELNSTIIAGGVFLDGVPHGAPFNTEFTNFVVWEYELSAAELPLLLDGDNEVVMTLGCAAPLEWFVMEYTALEADVPAPDGVGDICDLCPDAHDPEQADVDGDNDGDFCDANPNYP